MYVKGSCTVFESLNPFIACTTDNMIYKVMAQRFIFQGAGCDKIDRY